MNRWFEQHRQEWIAEALQVFGFVRRQHLVRRFGISATEASADLASFRQHNPRLLVLDAATRRHVISYEFVAASDDVDQSHPGDDAEPFGNRQRPTVAHWPCGHIATHACAQCLDELAARVRLLTGQPPAGHFHHADISVLRTTSKFSPALPARGKTDGKSKAADRQKAGTTQPAAQLSRR